MRILSLYFLDLATPRGRLSASIKFMAMLMMIHLLSLATEWVIFGGIYYAALPRFVITAVAGAPFIMLGLFGFTMARHSRSRLKTLALTDALTGLPNRRAFFDRIEEARQAGARGYLVILDADKFKAINDTQGHDVGDRALVAISDTMRLLEGADLTFGRIGGEEFAALATGSGARAQLDRIERKICARVDYLPTDGGDVARVSLSAGAVRFDPGEGTETLLRHADVALYRAKSDGGGKLIEETATVRSVAMTPQTA